MTAMTASASGPGVSTGPTAVASLASVIDDLDPDVSMSTLDGKALQCRAAGIQAPAGGGVVLPRVGAAGQDPRLQMSEAQRNTLEGAAVLVRVHAPLDVGQQQRSTLHAGGL